MEKRAYTRIEVGCIGHEGLSGFRDLLGVERTPRRASWRLAARPGGLPPSTCAWWSITVRR